MASDITVYIYFSSICTNDNQHVDMDFFKQVYQSFIHMMFYKRFFVVNIVICIVTITGFELYFRNTTFNAELISDENTTLSNRNISVLNYISDDLKNGILFHDVGKLTDRHQILAHSNPDHDGKHSTSYAYKIGTDHNITNDTSELHSIAKISGTQTHNVSDQSTTKHDKSITKTILHWNEYSSSGSTAINCPTCKCIVINNLFQITTVDAVMFSVFYLPNGTIPRHAHPRQVFVFLDYESQSRTFYLRSRHSSPFAFLNDFYNITMTFKDHPDTDIYVPYGTYVDQDPAIAGSSSLKYNFRDKTKIRSLDCQ